NEWLCPDLPHQPAEAFAQLCTLVEQAETRPKIVGSSLGGFYATALSARYNLKAVVINPAVHAPLVLRSELGLQTGYYDDTQYEFTQQHLDELQALDLLAPVYPEKILLMQETGDEVLDWQAAVDYYRDCHQLVFRGGDHGFTRFKDVIELIDRF
ncbi:MAG: hypothetical protein CR976_02495, partial [Thiotrichales bacterium]